MRNTNSKSILGRTAVASALLLGAAFASQAAMACTLDNWTSFSGAVAAGDPTPGDPDGEIARYSGLCGMAVTGAGYVEDENPGGIDRIVARFYVWAGNSGPSEVYAGYGDDAGGAKRFDVTVDGAGVITLNDTATNTSVSSAGNLNAWNSIEIDWAQAAGTGVIALQVNENPLEENTSLSNVGTQLQSVRLGNLNGSGGTTYFDAYESRRSTAVGRLCEGEITGDGTRTVDDVLEIFDEVASASVNLAVGQPDFDESGVVTIDDVLAVFDLVANALGDC